MSVYTQEVLGLLKRNKKKRELDKIRDHFEFGKLYPTFGFDINTKRIEDLKNYIDCQSH